MAAPETALPIPEVEPEPDLSDLRPLDAVVFVLFWLLALVVFLQFFTRYVLNDSLGWTEEIARFLLIGVTFTGAVMAERRGGHIAVEFLYRWVPRPARRVAQTVIDLLRTGFYAALAVFSAQVAGRTQQMMVSIDIPKSWVYWGVAACFATMTALAAWNGARHLRAGTSRLVDPEAHADATPARD